MRWLLLLFVATSCFTDQEHVYVDPRLQDSYNRFLQEVEKRNVQFYPRDLVITVGEIGTSGLCSCKKSGCTITINQAAFKGADSRALDYILFHELGHYMGRDHIDDFSIMNPNKYAGDFHNSEEKRTLLIDELLK